MTPTHLGRDFSSLSALGREFLRGLLIAASLFVVTLGLCSLHAQTIASGTIQGQISDPTGAAIPGASVEITQIETGVTTKVQADELGRYYVPALRVGGYSVTVGKEGFKTVRRTGLILQVNQIMDVSVALEVGAVSQEVTVTGGAPLIQTADATIGQVTENRQIVQLPLNGRSYAQIAFLSPTVVPAGGGSAASLFAPTFSVTANFSIGGNRGEDNEFTVDGFNTVQDNTGGSFVYPSIDGLQEFKIVQNSYMPDMGSRIGQVMVVSKGGTNSIHGSAYDFLRNDVLDARNSFALSKSPLRQNQFGFTVGGPIVKDKTFWFFGYEGTRIRRGVTRTAIVPNAAQRTGNFSDLLPGRQLIAPVNYPGAGLKAGDPIPGNRLDLLNIQNPGAINPIALNVIRLTGYPLPNAPGNLFILSPSNPTNQDYYQARIDHTISEKDRIWGSWFWEGFGNSTAAFTTNPKDRNVTHNLGQLIGIHWTRIIRSNLTNDLRAGYDYMKDDIPNASDPSFAGVSDADLGFPDNKFQPILGLRGGGAGIPSFQITGYGQAGGLGFGGPALYRFLHMELGDTLNYVRGPHRMAFGARILRFHQDQRHAEQGRGNYQFSGQYTGNGFADFLLGFPFLTTRQIIFVPNAFLQEFYDHGMQYGLFAQDSWQVSPRFTLSFGLRYDYFGPTVEQRGRQANFIPRGDQIVRVEAPGGTGGSISPSGTSLGTQGFDINPDCLCTRPTLDFSPRIAMAIRPFGANDGTVLRIGAGIFYGKTVENAQQSLQFNPPWILNDNQVNSAPVQSGGPGPTFNMTNGFPGLGAQATSGFSFDPNQKDITVQQWSFEIQRQISNTLMASVAYVGSQTYHGMRNPIFNEARPGMGPFQPRRPFPGAVAPSSDPFPVSPVFLAFNGGGYGSTANYNAMTLLVRKQFSQGLTFLSHFTWSKAIDTASAYLTSVQNPLNLAAERGLSNFNFGRRFVASWIYELPVGRGKPFLSNASGVVNQILGGWQTTGILGANDGSPFSPGDPFNRANTDFSGGNRPDRVCDGRISNRTRQQWFDPNCFRPAPLFTFGNAGRNTIFGPGAFTFDFSLMKDFRIKEPQRLQFRLEMFNAFNHTNLGSPTTAIGIPGLTGRIFGTQGGTTSSTGSRSIQFGLKYLF